MAEHHAERASVEVREEERKETFTGEEEDGQPPLALIAFDTVVAAIVADDATQRARTGAGNYSALADRNNECTPR